MSLDVYINTKCEHCGHSEQHGSFNYTYNLGQLWSDAMAAVGLGKPRSTSAANEAFGADRELSFGAWLQQKGKDCRAGAFLEQLDAMVAWMNTQDLKKYDAANGWGTGEGGRDFVKAIADRCRAHPKATLSVWR